MGKRIVVRGDVIFELDLNNLDETQLRYNICDFLVCVEKDNQIRYGVMVDVPNDSQFSQKSYIIEIPASATNPTDRAKEQKEVIKQYVDEMQSLFEAHLKSTKEGENDDFFDGYARTYDTIDGKWNIFREFRLTKMKSFFAWCLGLDEDPTLNPVSQMNAMKELSLKLVKNRMTFETGETYLISTDWAAPYFCYEKQANVSHFKDGYNAHGAKVYYPFHNFRFNMDEFSTKLTVSSSASSRIPFKLKPTYYSLFAYYAHLIDEIFMLRHENMEEIKPYYNYIQGLNFIGGQIMQKGPIKSGQHLKKLLDEANDDVIEDWDGCIDDDDHPNHDTQIALGLKDIDEAVNLFSYIINEESTEMGRNHDRSVKINVLCYALREAFFNHPYAKKNYEDLWAYNKDAFGVDLFIHRILTLLVDTKEAERVYHDFLHDHLFNNALLEDQFRAFENHQNDLDHWANIVYRSDAITFDVISLYLEMRMKLSMIKVNMGVEAVTPGVHKQVFSNMMEGIDSYTNLSDRGHKFSDIQLQKIVNFMIGGGKLEGIKKFEERMAQKIQSILGEATHYQISHSKVVALQNYHEELVDELIKEKPKKISAKADVSNLFSSSALNLILLGVAGYSTYSRDESASIEDHLRIASIVVGVTSDISNTVAYKASQIRPTLASTGGKLARRLGYLQLVGGGAGGIIGMVWFGIDAGRNFQKGNSKDGSLDLVSVVGVGLNTWALRFFSAGQVPLGLILSISGFSIMLVSQVIKWLGNETEDLCLSIYGNNLEDGGLEKFKHWEDELKNKELVISEIIYDKNERPNKIIDRVKTFIKDWDTFDKVSDD